MKIDTDKSDISKTNIPSKLYNFENGISQNVIDDVKSKFNIRANPVNLQSNTFAIYDISKYKTEFPFELENAEVIAHQETSGDNMSFSLVFQEENTKHTTKIEIKMRAPYENVELLDENTFKNTVLKALIITAEKLKVDQNMGHGLPSKIGNEFDYDKSKKTADLVTMKSEMLKDYNFLILKDYSKEFYENYKGNYDLDIDPEIIKKDNMNFPQ